MSVDVAQDALRWEKELINDFRTALMAKGKPAGKQLEGQIFDSWKKGLDRKWTFNDDLSSYDDDTFKSKMNEETEIIPYLIAIANIKYDKKGPKDWKDALDDDKQILEKLIEEANKP